ncbi:hypothetical protein LEP1GSC050_0705 [Leptospira broomii serovar Hurstbridge str. 5399]|uniref:Uncharacterized protein n=1 Tax=Leptospira broomii serovar Hurstbridge str. 5399 TaxID=1049789 RepID=T0GJB8_9LEPT|nr:hypothetical protein [Leptospira broomii]EQA46919.1 hypothetical protein LEP1GSC050_0705 [Leptospira broomii serovar Hurstbridge str. 5399]
MEIELMNMVNAGIGVVNLGKEEFERTKEIIIKKYEEFVAKGAADKSESSTRIRDLSIKVADSVKESKATIEKNAVEVRDKVLDAIQKFTSKEEVAIPVGKPAASKS